MTAGCDFSTKPGNFRQNNAAPHMLFLFGRRTLVKSFFHSRPGQIRINIYRDAISIQTRFRAMERAPIHNHDFPS
jgi:hypothetical protein